MSPIKKIPEFWRRRSLKFWMTTGMLMCLAPIFISAILGYFLYHGAIIQPLVEVAAKQRQILQPLQEVQMSLWDVSESVIDFSIDGKEQRKLTYQNKADQIGIDFEKLTVAMSHQGYDTSSINGAHDEWRELTDLSNTILSGELLHGNAFVGEEIEAFEARINHLAHQLETVHEAVNARNEQTHQQALASLLHSEYMAMIGLAISIIAAILGVIVINRSLVSSIDRLVSGSMRFSNGERNHQIKVEIPRELANVADAFNTMTKRICEQEKTLEYMARTDDLTGLYNRRELDRQLTEEIRRADRYNKPLSIILADLDHFKAFNDNHGHQVGDEVLRSVSKTLTANLREVDKACRFGGEEFVIILPECDAEAARQTAERVRSAIESSIIQLDEEQTAKLTISIGVATSPHDGTTPESLLKSADVAMYQAKERGRNRVVLAAN